jgi:UDP:flavonoid glycosyltransferase YjiC (YdhE family)
MAEPVAAAGFAFVAGGEPAETDVAPIRELLPRVSPAEASVLGNRELFGRLAARALLPTVETTVSAWRPDLVLRDPCEHASAVVALRRGLPVAQVAISLAENEWGSIAVAQPALDDFAPSLADAERVTPYVSRFPAALDPSPFPNTIRTRDDQPPAEPLTDWWSGSSAPLVYLTFGTVLAHMTFAAQVYRVALAALDGLGCRVLLTVGRHFDPVSLGPLPPLVQVEPWVDQASALSAADVVVCHGGSGTVFGALAAGVPLVVVPVFADQFVNGRLVAGVGAGRLVEVDGGSRKRVVDQRDTMRIREAVISVLADHGARERAQSIAEAMAAAPSADDVLEML